MRLVETLVLFGLAASLLRRRGLGTFVRRSLASRSTGPDSPLRIELAAWMDRAHAAGLDREDVEALYADVREEKYPR